MTKPSQTALQDCIPFSLLNGCLFMLVVTISNWEKIGPDDWRIVMSLLFLLGFSATCVFYFLFLYPLLRLMEYLFDD